MKHAPPPKNAHKTHNAVNFQKCVLHSDSSEEESEF